MLSFVGNFFQSNETKKRKAAYKRINKQFEDILEVTKNLPDSKEKDILIAEVTKQKKLLNKFQK